jgi:hypothetical protein
MVDTVVMFYDYLLRHESMENQLSEKLVKFVRDPGRNYRSFLHGIAENRMIKSHILKLPVPRIDNYTGRMAIRHTAPHIGFHIQRIIYFEVFFHNFFKSQ